MAHQLRNGMERLRQYYINKLLKSGIYHTSDQKLNTLTLTELKNIVKQTIPSKK